MINANWWEFRTYAIILHKESSYGLIQINTCILGVEIANYENAKIKRECTSYWYNYQDIVMKIEDLWFSVNKIYLRIYYFGVRFNIDTYKC